MATSNDATDPRLTVPLPPSGRGSDHWWSDQVTQSKKRRKKELPLWKANLERYRSVKPSIAGFNPRDVVGVNVEFSKTEAKKSQLFFQQPDVQLTPRQGQTAAAVALFREALNFYLGADEANALSMVDEVLLDVLCPCGLGFTKIGFEEATIQKALPVMDPTTGQPATEPHPDTGLPQPKMQTVPQRVYGRFFWERISPSRALIPAGWLTQNFDRAPWLGFEYDLVDPDKHTETTRPLSGGDGETVSADDTLSAVNDRAFLARPGTGIEIFYRASVYDPSVTDPRRYRRIVMEAHGRSKQVVTVHEDSPYQTLGASGEFQAGMLGNPIHILYIRPMADSAYVPSDCTISRLQTDELSKGRTQQMVQRDRNLPMRAADKSRVDKGVLDKIEKGETQSIILTDGDPDQALKVIQQAAAPVENMAFNAALTNDITELWALGANQSGATNNRATTATESANIARGVDNRLVKERGRVENWYIQGVEKFSALLQLFGDDDTFVPIIGADNQAQMTLWNKTKTPGRFLFRVRPDSSVRIDASEDLDRLLRAYNLLAKDPHVNRVKLLTQIVSKFGFDPQELLIQQLPAPPPEHPKPSINFKGEDMSNLVVQQFLTQNYGLIFPPPPPPSPPLPLSGLPGAPGAGLAGAPVPPSPPVLPPAPLLVNQPHGGAADLADMLDKHEGDRSAHRPGPRPS
jgi:hypothetical protein